MTKRNLYQLQQEAFSHYEQLFSSARDPKSKHWTKEKELLLARLVEIKESVKNNAEHFFHEHEDSTERILKIEHLTEAAEQLKKASQIYDRLSIGMDQDSHFPRKKEYLSKLRSLHQVSSDKGSKLFEKTQVFIQESIVTIQKRSARAEEEAKELRITKAAELLKTIMRSPPATPLEIRKKAATLEKTLAEHLMPLQGCGHPALDNLILEYQEALAYYNEQAKQDSESR